MPARDLKINHTYTTMKKPIKKVAFVDSFALLTNVGETMEIPVRERTESCVRKAACKYSADNGVTLSVSFNQQRLVSIVTRTQ